MIIPIIILTEKQNSLDFTRFSNHITKTLSLVFNRKFYFLFSLYYIHGNVNFIKLPQFT